LALAVREAPRVHKDAAAIAGWAWRRMPTERIVEKASAIGRRRGSGT
ncbi:MAG: hypothetical protein GX344_09815, partial [Intrasporangiaceae bacterium]|nr:hypothetical protein [Intrasporangiaceae bacterium]